MSLESTALAPETWRRLVSGAPSPTAPATLLARQVLDQLWWGRGYVCFDLSSAVEALEKPASVGLAEILCGHLGRVLRVTNGDVWVPLSVDLNAHPERAHGVGPNPLHVDLLTREFPPTVIALVCVRADPLAGGVTTLGDLNRAIAGLSPGAIEVLQRPIFRYWADTGVAECGPYLPAFSVLPRRPGEGPVRFTTKLLPLLESRELGLVDQSPATIAAARNALLEMRAALAKQSLRHLLSENELLLFHQWRWAHGREALAPGQEAIPPEARRLLLQAYINAHPPETRCHS